MADRCTGCGVCEASCPIIGEAAVKIVAREVADRHSRVTLQAPALRYTMGTMASQTANDLLDAVLKLPANDRVRIAREVVRSLGDESNSEAVDDAWRAEIERRVDDILEGRVELVPAREVMEDLRAELRAMRE